LYWLFLSSLLFETVQRSHRLIVEKMTIRSDCVGFREIVEVPRLSRRDGEELVQEVEGPGVELLLVEVRTGVLMTEIHKMARGLNQ
jgi:hypothetical protein